MSSLFYNDNKCYHFHHLALKETHHLTSALFWEVDLNKGGFCLFRWGRILHSAKFHRHLLWGIKKCRNRPSRVHVLKKTFVFSANSSCHWETFFLLPYLNSFHLRKPLSDFEIADLFNFHFSPPSLAPPVDIMFRFLHRWYLTGFETKKESINLNKAALFLETWSTNFNGNNWVLKGETSLKGHQQSNLTLVLHLWLGCS